MRARRELDGDRTLMAKSPELVDSGDLVHARLRDGELDDPARLHAIGTTWFARQRLLHG